MVIIKKKELVMKKMLDDEPVKDITEDILEVLEPMVGDGLSKEKAVVEESLEVEELPEKKSKNKRKKISLQVTSITARVMTRPDYDLSNKRVYLAKKGQRLSGIMVGDGWYEVSRGFIEAKRVKVV
jgi:hypothetical protein